MSRIYRPKFYRYWSKNKGFTHVLTGRCTEKFFRHFLLSGKFFFNPRPPARQNFCKIAARNKNLLQGIISFARTILADTLRIKASFAPGLITYPVGEMGLSDLRSRLIFSNKLFTPEQTALIFAVFPRPSKSFNICQRCCLTNFTIADVGQDIRIRCGTNVHDHGNVPSGLTFLQTGKSYFL